MSKLQKKVIITEDVKYHFKFTTISCLLLIHGFKCLKVTAAFIYPSHALADVERHQEQEISRLTTKSICMKILMNIHN